MIKHLLFRIVPNLTDFKIFFIFMYYRYVRSDLVALENTINNILRDYTKNIVIFFSFSRGTCF